MPEGKNNELAGLMTVLLAVAFFGLDFVTPIISDRLDRARIPFLMAVVITIPMAHAMLIAIWTVLAPVNIVLRLSSCFLLSMMLWYLLLGGVLAGVAHGPPNPQESLAMGVFVVGGIMALQIPLWIAKRGFRCRVIFRYGSSPTGGSERMQFQLKDLLIATFLIAIALAPLRAVVPDEKAGGIGPGWGEVLVMLATAIAINLVGTLPGLWGGFSSRSAGAVVGLLAGYSLVAVVAEIIVVWMIAGFPASFPPEAGEMFAALYVLNLVQGLVVFGVLRIYRSLGYGWQRRASKMSEVQLGVKGLDSTVESPREPAPSDETEDTSSSPTEQPTLDADATAKEPEA